MRAYWFLLCVFVISAIVSCGHEADETFENCEDVEDIIQIIDDALDKNDFLSKFEKTSDFLILEFNDTPSIAISLLCIRDVEALDNNLLRLQLQSDDVKFIGLGKPIIFDYDYNPEGFTPLSSRLRFSFPEQNGTLKVRVTGKDNDAGTIEKHFDQTSSTFDVPILGMYFDHINEIEVDFLVNDNIVWQHRFEQATPKTPDYLPEVIVDVYKPDQMEPGLNFISYRAKESPAVPFMLDPQGEVRYLLDFSSSNRLQFLNYDVGIERLQNGNFYFGAWPSPNIFEVDIFGNTINTWFLSGYTFHHNVQEKEDGNLLVTASKNGSFYHDGNLSTEDFVVEIDRNSGFIIQEWDLRVSLDEMRVVQGFDNWGGVIDWVHTNAVIHDPSDNTIIVSTRRQGIAKLDYNNRVVWVLNNHLGWDRNKQGQFFEDVLLKPRDANGVLIEDQRILDGLDNHPDFEWPWYQHAPFIHPDGTLFCFDNGDFRNYSSIEKYSRAVGYKINKDDLTVEQVFSYGKERGIDTYSRIVSDVDYLPEKDNILFAPGAGVLNGPGIFGAKLIELDFQSQEVVYEMRMNVSGIVWHRVERMSLYP